MNPRQTSTMLVAAAALGISASHLLWEGPTGPGLAIWVALLGGSAVMVARLEEVRWQRRVAVWSGVATLAALATTWRAAEELQALLFLALILSASMVVLEARGRRFGRTRVLDHVHGVALVPFLAAGGALPLLLRVRVPSGEARSRAWALGRGLLLAAPPLVLFAGLFASADPSFARGVGRLTGLASEETLAHLVLAGAFGWIGAGLLRGVVPGARSNPVARLRPPRVGVEETAVVLGLVTALFAAFVLLQLGYLFGGRGAIESISGLTVAEYARRGFFELVAAAGLVLVLLLALGAAAPAGTGRTVYRSLAATLIGLVLIVIVSAFLRLNLYVDTFGLTTDRLYAATFMAWLTCALVWFSATVIRGRPRPFASGALATGLVAVFALVALNPHGLVARTNLARDRATPVDHGYLWSLGGDAVPHLIPLLDAMPDAERCRAVRRALGRWGPDAEGTHARGVEDWRRWNAGTARARRAVTDARPRLQEIEATCGKDAPAQMEAAPAG